MASQSIIDGDLTVRGAVRPTTLKVPPGSVGDAGFSASDPLTAAKQEHQHQPAYAQAGGSAAADDRRVFHVAYAAGSVFSVRAGVTTACLGDSTITVDVQKNGATILSAPVVIDSTNAAYAREAASVATAAYAAGDVFEIVATVAAGTGTPGRGLFADVVFREASGG